MLDEDKKVLLLDLNKKLMDEYNDTITKLSKTNQNIFIENSFEMINLDKTPKELFNNRFRGFEFSTANDLYISNKYSYFIKFKENILSNFELINEIEICNFISCNLGLIEFLKKVTTIIKSKFPNDCYALEFNEDPEIPSFNKLILYINTDNESFDEYWQEIRQINKEIRKLSLYDDSVKSLLSIDLW